MHDPEELLTENSEVVARLDLAGYLLRCTSNVVIVTMDGGLTAQAVARHLALALAGGSDIAGAIVDVTTAHNRDRLGERLLLDEGTDPKAPGAAEQLAGRLQARRLGLAVIIEDAHGLPPELLKTLIGLARQVSQRDATMPVALVCPEAEADYLEGIAQNAGRAPEQIQRITLLPMAEQQPRRRGWRLGRAWLALPVLAVAAGALSLYWLGPRLGAISEPETSGDPIAEVSTTRPEPVASAPPTEGTADDAHGGDDAVVSLPPQIASASVFMTATIPALPEPLRTGTTTPPADVASARDRDLAENPLGDPEGRIPDASPVDTGPLVASGSTAVEESEPAAGTRASGEGEGAEIAPATVPVGAPDAVPEQASVHTSDREPVDAPASDATADTTEAMENGDTPGTGSTDNGTAGGNVEVSDQDWLASRDAQRYTLQLIAGRQEATTERFINAHTGLRDQVRVVTVDGDDGTWHLVLLGDYPSRAQAMGSRPEGFAQDDVYARSFASVRGD